MKRRTKHLSVRDGTLIPMGNNFAYVLGDHPNKVDDVDIGPNNRNGLSVNHGEIMQFGGNGVRVFSAEPILGGISPSRLVQAGMNPNAVFAAQERYKDIHHLKDDGSHAKFGDWIRGLFGKKQITTAEDTPEYYGGDIEPAVVTAALPAKFNGSQAAANKYAEGYQFGKKIARKRDELAPYLMPLVMGSLAPAAILGEGGGKIVDTGIQRHTNNKRSGWADATTFFLDKNPRAKVIGETVASFLNPGYSLAGFIATPTGAYKGANGVKRLMNADWKPSVKNKYDVVPSSIKNTLNIDTPENKLLRDRIARQVGNFPNQQRKIYNKSLHYIGQAFDDVPENIQKDILNNTDILDSFITRVRWGEGKNMIPSLKYEANKIAFRDKQNIAYAKRINYRYKNVPSIFRNTSSINDNPNYITLVKNFGKSNVDKARYYLSKALREEGYNKISPNTDYNDLIGQIAYSIKNKKFSKVTVPHYNRISKTPFDKINDFVKKYGIEKQIDPAEGIINKELQEIARISPKYAGEIYASEVLGDTPEEIVNTLLNKKWTFIRGINDSTGNLGLEDAKIAMNKIAENAKGGRSDTKVFTSILPSEDIVYFSNSPTTAISYTYPTQQGKGYIGIFGRKDPFIEGKNLIDKWIKNQLPEDNILEAPSTIRRNIPGIEIPENKLKSFEFGLKKGKERGKLQGAGEADNHLYNLMRPKIEDSGYRHFLIKGNRGEEIPYLKLKDIREVPKIGIDSYDYNDYWHVINDTEDDFNALLKEFNVDAKDLNRGHSNKYDVHFSLGKKLGGIHIAPSKRGTFTAAAKQHGIGVQAFASRVLANKSNYSSAMVKKANFARNASKWHHALGGEEPINLQNLINRINSTSNADFVKRLKDPNREYIKQGNRIYTHLMSYVTNDNDAIVYPEVQNTNKGLKRFKGRKALDRAIEYGDTLHMTIPEAEVFTRQYKDYYPGFKLGGETEVKKDYLTIPLKGNPLYDITGETKYSDYTNEPVIDFSGIETTNKRPYNAANAKTAYDYFKAQGANDYQIAALLANAIEESGIEPYALDKTDTYYGISQWDKGRYSAARKSKKDKDYSTEVELQDLNNQLSYYYNSVMNGNTRVDWNHGGKGSGYNTAADARQAFKDAISVDDAVKALVLGYVRPTGGIDSYKNRVKVAEQIYKLISKQ